MRRNNTCGVYKIINTMTEDFYIGSSIEIEIRWNNHKTLARRYEEGGKWRVSRLYRAIRKYGVENFKIEILERCTVDLLREREQYHMDTLQPQYNMSPTATGGGVEWSPERKQEYSTRRKVEVAAGINVPPITWMTGNKDFHHSESSKRKMQKSAAKARERVAQERDSYLTPEGLASRQAKQVEWLTPERRQQFVEDTEEARRLAHEAFQQKTEAFAERFAPLILALQNEGLNFKEIGERLTTEGHTARHGGPWTDQSVADLLSRVGQTPDRPRMLPAEQTRKKNADAFAERFFPMIDEMRQFGLNMSKIAIRLNEDGHQSRRGAPWTYQNVREVIKRCSRVAIEEPLERIVPDLMSRPRYIGWDRRS